MNRIQERLTDDYNIVLLEGNKTKGMSLFQQCSQEKTMPDIWQNSNGMIFMRNSSFPPDKIVNNSPSQIFFPLR